MLEKYPVVLAVAAFIKDENNKILVVKKAAGEPVDGGLWTIPGGKIEPKEAILDGLRREIMEEVGLKIVDYDWIGEDVFESGGWWYHGQHFLCHAEDISKIHLEPTLLEYKWVSKEDLDSLDFHPNIKKRLQEIFS